MKVFTSLNKVKNWSLMHDDYEFIMEDGISLPWGVSTMKPGTAMNLRCFVPHSRLFDGTVFYYNTYIARIF